MASDPTHANPGGEEGSEQDLVFERGMRAQSIQRLQVGAFGLIAMVLLVGLANIIMANARQNEALVVPEAAATVAPTPTPAQANDPLANAGVVPDLPNEPTPTPTLTPPPVITVNPADNGAASTQP